MPVGAILDCPQHQRRLSTRWPKNLIAEYPEGKDMVVELQNDIEAVE